MTKSVAHLVKVPNSTHQSEGKREHGARSVDDDLRQERAQPDPVSRDLAFELFEGAMVEVMHDCRGLVHECVPSNNDLEEHGEVVAAEGFATGAESRVEASDLPEEARAK